MVLLKIESITQSQVILLDPALLAVKENEERSPFMLSRVVLRDAIRMEAETVAEGPWSLALSPAHARTDG